MKRLANKDKSMLPKWACEIITQNENRIKELEGILRVDREDTKDSKIGFCVGMEKTKLPLCVRSIEFLVNGKTISAMIRKEGDNEVLDINCWEHIALLPRASNSVYIQSIK